MGKGTSTQNRRRRKRRWTPRVPGALGVSSNTLSCVSRFPLTSVTLSALAPLARRDIWCRPLPQSRVPSAISSALKPLQLQTPTVSSPLFRPVLLRAPLTSTFLPLFPSFSLFGSTLVRSLARSLARRSPAPFTFAHYSRKSNFVTRAGSSTQARIPSSIPGKLHVGRHRRLERRFPLSSTASFYRPPHTGCPLTPSNQPLPRYNDTRTRKTRNSGSGFGTNC